MSRNKMNCTFFIEEKWFVLENGNDTPGCGDTLQNACRTVRYRVNTLETNFYMNDNGLRLESLDIKMDTSIVIDQHVMVSQRFFNQYR